MARTIEVGTLVIDASGQKYTYGGPSEMGGITQIRYNLRTDEWAKIFTDPDQVAPADVAETVDLKDPRITVLQYDHKPRYAPGKWCHDAELPDGTHHTGWHKTKRDGVAEAAHRLAIADWHAADVK